MPLAGLHFCLGFDFVTPLVVIFLIKHHHHVTDSNKALLYFFAALTLGMAVGIMIILFLYRKTRLLKGKINMLVSMATHDMSMN
jgi:hypothetical protein